MIPSFRSRVSQSLLGRVRGIFQFLEGTKFNMSKNWIFLEIFFAIREGTDLWPHYSKLILSKKVDTFAKLPPAFRGKWDYMARRISVEMNFTYQAIASEFIFADYYNNFNFKALFNVVVSLLPKEWFFFVYHKFMAFLMKRKKTRHLVIWTKILILHYNRVSS